MPELPDISVYVERLAALVKGHLLERVRVVSPFVVRTFDPPISELAGKVVQSTSRIGKRIVLHTEGDLHLVLHLMIAGRLRWRERGATLVKKVGLAAFDFDNGTLLLTEASTKKRASIHLVRGRAGLEEFQRGGIEPLEASPDDLAEALSRENRTLKRALTDPRLVSGIGNAYSDEILFAARLSPMKLTSQLTPEEIERLHRATIETLTEFTARLRKEVGEGFPETVTAFRKDMAVHGRYREPCRVCGTSIQRIRYAENEANYCPRCQTGGKLLSDRSLSRLLHGDWPKTMDELEERRAGTGAVPRNPPVSPRAGSRPRKRAT